MTEKKEQYDSLDKKHIYQLWESDLNELLISLEKVEAKDEADRKAHSDKIKIPGSKKRGK